MQFASQTMNSSQRQFFAGGQEALAVIFVLKHFLLHLLSSEPFALLTDHQALRSAFLRKAVHGRLARVLDFLAEFGFKFSYCKGSSNEEGDFLSRLFHGETGIDGMDWGDFVCVVGDERGWMILHWT